MAESVERLAPLIREMLDPGVYPVPAERVSLVQTHISFIFLVGSRAYKVKKPVNLGFLDYSTLGLRERFCRREVELNRRLAPDLYLGVEPIVQTPEGIRVGGEGEPLEWCVVMQRLPENRLLSVLLSRGEVTADQIRAVARPVAAFHRDARTGGEIDAFGNPRTIRVNTDENFRQLAPYVGRTVDADRFARIHAYTDRFLDQNARLFAERIDRQRIRDCHGDLHADSICLGDDIQIFDCIEFNDRFRYGDVAAEVAFLTMDLEHFGRADLAWHFVDAYRQASGDDVAKGLLDFYACYRAVVRAKVECFKLDDPGFTADERIVAGQAASVYLDVALAHSASESRPTLLLMTGLMGTGKTTLARELSRRFGFVYLSSDVTRKRLAGLVPGTHRSEAFGEGIYAEAFSRQTYAALFSDARVWLDRGVSVVVDASFKHEAEREQARQLAGQAGGRFVAIECVCPEDEVHRRLDDRESDATSASDGRWGIFERQKADFVPWPPSDRPTHHVVRTDQPLARCVDEVRSYLFGPPPDRVSTAEAYPVECPVG